MTYKEKLKQEHPEWDDIDIDYAITSDCPRSHFNLDSSKPEGCGGGDDIANCYKCWNQDIPEENVDKDMTMETCKIKDSGDRTEFATGAVRDMREGKGRCDLMPLEVVSRIVNYDKGDSILDEIRMFQIDGQTRHLYECLDTFAMRAFEANRWTMFLEVAKHFEEGAKKYGENNWQMGIPVHCYIDSAIRHYLKRLRGDKDEPHDRAFVWNLMCCIWEVDHHNKEVAE